MLQYPLLLTTVRYVTVVPVIWTQTVVTERMLPLPSRVPTEVLRIGKTLV